MAHCCWVGCPPWSSGKDGGSPSTRPHPPRQGKGAAGGTRVAAPPHARESPLTWRWATAGLAPGGQSASLWHFQIFGCHFFSEMGCYLRVVTKIFNLVPSNIVINSSRPLTF